MGTENLVRILKAFRAHLQVRGRQIAASDTRDLAALRRVHIGWRGR